MNPTRYCRIRTLILVVVAIVWLAVGIFGVTCPMAYDTSYYHATFYEGEDFNGTMTFHKDNTMAVNNTNFDEEFVCYYYYKDGYIFFPVGMTQEEYEEEVAAIEADFEGAVNAPFYASKINGFRLSSEGLDGYTSVYICQSSVMMAIVWGVVQLVLLGFTVAAVLRGKKKYEE